jgi:glycosyltransferase involved in cell wall biosynthesis
VAERLTAVVTTRNRRSILPMTLGAIVHQEGVDVDVVVVDEGSSDGTAEYLRSIEGPGITVIRHDVPLGLPAARNVGFRASTTRWIAVCDDDDIWSPTKARGQLELLASRPDARWCVAGTALVDPDLRVIGYREMDDSGDVLGDMLVANPVPGVSGLVVDRDLYDEVGQWDESLRASEDWDLEIRMAAVAPVVSLHGPHVAYRVAGGSMSTDVDRMRASFHTIHGRYRHLAEERGVVTDPDAYEAYLGRQAVTARQRVDAATCYLRAARGQRDPRHLVRAAVGFAAPAWMDRTGTRRSVDRVPPAFLAEARSWLTTVPRLEPTVSGAA